MDRYNESSDVPPVCAREMSSSNLVTAGCHPFTSCCFFAGAVLLAIKLESCFSSLSAVAVSRTVQTFTSQRAVLTGWTGKSRTSSNRLPWAPGSEQETPYYSQPT